MQEIYSKENYLNYIYFVIDSINLFITEKTKTKDLAVNPDKIEEFKNIKQFISGIGDENTYQNIVGQLKLLIGQTNEFTADLAPANFKNDDAKRLTIMYLLLLKTDLNKVLSINPNQLYLTINAMRCVPYKKYRECIDKLTYSKLVEIINTEGPTDQTRIVLNTLTDEISDSKKDYDPTKLDDDMDQFIMVDVYSRITPPMTGDKDSDLLLKLHADRSYNLKNIRNAEKVNRSLYLSDYKPKFDSLEQYDKMEFDLDTAQTYLNIIEYLKYETDSRAFAMTNLELTTLSVMNYININTFTLEELYQIIIKLNNRSYSEYEELLIDTEKHR